MQSKYEKRDTTMPGVRRGVACYDRPTDASDARTTSGHAWKSGGLGYGAPMGAVVVLIVIVASLFPLMSSGVQAAVRLKDIAKVQGAHEAQLIGQGIVVGLDGTGDKRGVVFTVQSVVNMLKRMGTTVPPEDVKLKNVASVVVTAKLSPFTRTGSAVDVTVSSLGDATSLQGGTLLMTPLYSGSDLQRPYAIAQGAVSIGGFNISAGGEHVQKNHSLAGRIPNGAIVERELPPVSSVPDSLTITLFDPDYTTADRVASAVRQKFGEGAADPLDAGTVFVQVPPDRRGSRSLVGFIADLEALSVTPDASARVVVNEKTGTVVAGENVTIAAVAVAHGGLSVEIRETPVVSQPAPMAQRGQTVVVPQKQVSVTETQLHMVALEKTANVGDVAKVLNALGVTPRDLVAIFQALKEAGALRAELILL